LRRVSRSFCHGSIISHRVRGNAEQKSVHIKSVTYSFDVTTSTKAVSDLTIDQTPMGWIDSGVTTDTAACSINKQ
ncbi:hypothetical protein ABG885_10025, partial [Bifidobacterium longum]